MSERRTAIPKDTQREIFSEAGHRCACCGESFPLERAHIVPWSKSSDHSPQNLICLCPNCHEIADRSWDEKTFRIYKNNPWILRKRLSEPPTTGSSTTAPRFTVLCDETPVQITEEYIDALKQVMRAEIAMMRATSDHPECWLWGVCIVGDLGLANKLTFEYGGDEYKPYKMIDDVEVFFTSR